MVVRMGFQYSRVRITGVDRTETRPAAQTEIDRLARCVVQVLSDSPLCSCATLTADGVPHINTAYFAYSPDLDLCFLSHPGSQHCRNLLTNRSLAVAVYASHQKWTEPGRGLQLFGRCTQAAGEGAERAWQTYAGRFPAVHAWRDGLRAGSKESEYCFFCFEPDVVKLLDEAEFGDARWVIADIERRP